MMRLGCHYALVEGNKKKPLQSSIGQCFYFQFITGNRNFLLVVNKSSFSCTVKHNKQGGLGPFNSASTCLFCVFFFSFMDKMYILSSEIALEKFMKNPRRYLVPPQPTLPSKFVVMGPPMSGKSTLAQQLAEKYSGTVSFM